MAQARSSAAWKHTSAVLALVANVFRGKGKPKARPSDFDPHAKASLPVADFKDLKAAFGRGQEKAGQEGEAAPHLGGPIWGSGAVAAPAF